MSMHHKHFQLDWRSSIICGNHSIPTITFSFFVCLKQTPRALSPLFDPYRCQCTRKFYKFVDNFCFYFCRLFLRKLKYPKSMCIILEFIWLKKKMKETIVVSARFSFCYYHYTLSYHKMHGQIGLDT